MSGTSNQKRDTNMDHIDVPFLDLVTPHVEMEEQLTDIFRNALHTAGFIGGKLICCRQRFTLSASLPPSPGKVTTEISTLLSFTPALKLA